MAVIEEFEARLDELIDIIQSARSFCASSYQDHLAPSKRIDADREGFPQAVASSALAVTEVSELSARLHSQLQQLEQELTVAAQSLGQEARLRLEAMDKSTQEVEGLLHQLTDTVGATQRETRTVLAELSTASTRLGTESEAQAGKLKEASAPAQGALLAAAEVARGTYVPALFGELAEVLRGVQAQLDMAAAETLPQARGKLEQELASTHHDSVRDSLKNCGTQAQEAQAAYLGAAQQNATDMRTVERTEVEALQKLTTHELPDRANTAVRNEAEKGLRQMAEEAAKLWLVAGNMSAYLNKEQDPFLPAVRELHLALKGMLK